LIPQTGRRAVAITFADAGVRLRIRIEPESPQVTARQQVTDAALDQKN
jgi:hypothetical protein